MKLAIYDFDGTYVLKQTLPYLFKLWKREKINNKAYNKYWLRIMWRYLLYRLHLFGWNKQTFRAGAMKITADLFRSIEREKLNKFLDLFYQEIQPFISKEMSQQLKKDNEEGFYTILLSGNFNIILKPFLAEGFKEVIGTNVEGENGLKKSNEVEIIINKRKQDIIEHLFKEADFKNSKAYADSDYDLPILELVGNPIVVNPDKELTKIALERNFKIMYTNKKV